MPSSHYDGDDTKVKGADNTLIGNVDKLLTTTDMDFARLYDGVAYNLNVEYILNNGQTVDHSFQTPNTSAVICAMFKTYSADRSEVQIWEAPTITTYAFSWTPKNRNRISSNTSAVVFQTITTTASAGTFLFKESNYGSGISVNQSPINRSSWFVLDQNTEYLFRIISHAANNLHTFQINWYEVG